MANEHDYKAQTIFNLVFNETTKQLKVESSVLDSINTKTPIDELTGARTTVDYSHHEVHEGNSFTCGVFQTTTNADDKRTTMTITTPAGTKLLHLVPYGSSTGEVHFYLFEDVAVGTETSVVAAYNRNRNGGASIATFKYFDEDAAGEVTGGTQIYHEHLGAGRATADKTSGRQEFILKPSEDYAIIIENEGASGNLHNIVLNWYEHEI